MATVQEAAGSSVLIIEERDGKRRKVTLRGGALPFQGAEWGGEMELVTQWNPGNPVGTQQVLGPQEMPSEWEGFWHSTLFFAAPPDLAANGASPVSILRADDLRDVLEAIYRDGRVLTVTWIPQANRRRVARIGRAKSWKFQHTRADDIKWTTQFEWMGRANETPRTANDFLGNDVIAAGRAALASLTVLASYQKRLQGGSPHFFGLGDLESLANGPKAILASFARAANSIVNRLDRLGRLLIKIRDVPASLLGQTVDVARGAVGACNRFVDAISREGPETMETRNKLSALAAAGKFYSDSQTQADVASGQAQLLANSAARRDISPRTRGGSGRKTNAAGEGVLQLYTPRANDTMVTISVKFYSTPDLAYELCLANNLKGDTVKPKLRVLVIPTREALQRLRPSPINQAGINPRITY